MLYQLSYEATHWERGQFIEFISVTMHVKTYLNTYLLDGQKRQASASYLLESFLKNVRGVSPTVRR